MLVVLDSFIYNKVIYEQSTPEIFPVFVSPERYKEFGEATSKCKENDTINNEKMFLTFVKPLSLQ